MEKNTIWAIVLSSIVLIGSMLIQNHFFPPQKVVTTEQEVVISEELENLPEQIDEVVTQVVEFTSDSIPEEEITVNTGKAQITLTNKGGDIISYELLDHKDKDGYASQEKQYPHQPTSVVEQRPKGHLSCRCVLYRQLGCLQKFNHNFVCFFKV